MAYGQCNGLILEDGITLETTTLALIIRFLEDQLDQERLHFSLEEISEIQIQMSAYFTALTLSTFAKSNLAPQEHSQLEIKSENHLALTVALKHQPKHQLRLQLKSLLRLQPKSQLKHPPRLQLKHQLKSQLKHPPRHQLKHQLKSQPKRQPKSPLRLQLKRPLKHQLRHQLKHPAEVASSETKCV